jgi:hypothetical protein
MIPITSCILTVTDSWDHTKLRNKHRFVERGLTLAVSRESPLFAPEIMLADSLNLANAR